MDDLDFGSNLDINQGQFLKISQTNFCYKNTITRFFSKNTINFFLFLNSILNYLFGSVQIQIQFSKYIKS